MASNHPGAVGGDKALAGCCYGRRPRPDQGLIHRPTKTEVTAVVTRSVAAIRAAVARTNWRSLRPTTCPYVNDTPRREAARTRAIGKTVIGTVLTVALLASAPARRGQLRVGVPFCILEQWVTDCLGQSLLPTM
jgi:hypothetical protein